MLLNIPYFFIGVTLLVGTLRIKELNKPQKYLLILVLITAVVEFVSLLLWRQKINNLPLYHFYAIVEFFILSSIFQLQLRERVPSFWIISLKIGMVVFASLNIIFFQNIYEFNSNVIVASSVILIAFSFIYFYYLLNAGHHYPLESNYMFWISTGVLIYFSSSLALFCLTSYLLSLPIETQTIVWGIHAVFNILHYLAFTIALWLKPMTKPY